MKSSYQTVRFTPGTDTFLLPAGIATKFGYITIPSNCIAVIMFNVHNRTNQPDLEFGIATSDAVENAMWDGTHIKVTQFYSASNTWVHYNNTNAPVNVNVFGKASIDTTLMYAICHALCVPILN